MPYHLLNIFRVIPSNKKLPFFAIIFQTTKKKGKKLSNHFLIRFNEESVRFDWQLRCSGVVDKKLERLKPR